MINWGGMILYMTLQKGTNTYVHLHQPKKWLQEAKAQGSNIKSKGLDLFWLNTCGWSSKVGPTGKKVASPGQSSTDRTWWDEIKNFVSTRAQIETHMFYCWKYSCPCKRVQTHMSSFTNQKRWLQEAEAHVSNIKSKGLDLFWLNTCGWSSKVGPTGKKSHHQANHPQIGHDGTKSRILCQRAPKLKHTCFIAENTVVLAKGYNHICSASPTKKGDLKRPRRRCQK